jgi:iron complex transport system substrate-binding protein
MTEPLLLAARKPTRREFLIGAAGLLVLAPGCGGDPAPGSQGGRGAGGAFPRTVEHELGSTDVPERPARIVSATGLAELDALLALGAKPVAAGRFPTGWNPWTEARDLGGIEPLAVDPEINIEQVAAQRPDLIIGQTGRVRDENYGELSGIAPTVATSFEDWRLNVEQVADALGRAEDGRRLVRKTDAGITEAGERLSGYRDLAVSVFPYFPGEPALLTDDSFCGDVMRKMGLKRPPSQTDQEAPEGYKPISEERIGLIDGDVIFGLGFEDNAGAMDEFEQSELFRRLEGVSAKRYVRLGPDESLAMYFASVLTVPVVLRLLEERLGEVRR